MSDAEVNNNEPAGKMFTLLSSPMRVSLNDATTHQQQLKKQISEDNHQNFHVIFEKFSSLLDELSGIYKEIGYSQNEVQKNEKLLFTTMSNSLDKFFQDSIQCRNNLREDNSKINLILARLLNISDDPNGDRTIPDLYLRNLVLKSSHERTTLRNIRKSLTAASSYVFKDYKEKLSDYLSLSLKLNALKSRIDNFDTKRSLSIPDMIEVRQVLELIESADSLESFHDIISNNSGLFLDSSRLNDLSNKKRTSVIEMIQLYQTELEHRAQHLRELSNEILNISETLHIDSETETSMWIKDVLSFSKTSTDLDTVDVSSTTINKFKSILDSIKEIQQQRKSEKSELEQQCESLWMKLKKDTEYVKRFKEENRDLSQTAINNYSSELTGLLQMKNELLKELILDARVTIETLWNQLYISEPERAKFKEFFTDNKFDDDILSKHEAEIEILTEKYESYKPVLKLIESFKALVGDKKKLEESSKDSSRLLQRNSHKILMEEERLRKRISKELPKVIKDLRLRIDEYEHQFGKSLRVNLAEEILLLEEEEMILKNRVARKGSSHASSISRVASRVGTANASCISSRVPSRAPSRAPSRVPSKAPSRVNSRVTSPIKNTSQRYQSQGIQKPISSIPNFKRITRSSNRPPTLSKSQSSLLPTLHSPQKERTLSIMPDMIQDQSVDRRENPNFRTISSTKGHKSFQPNLGKVPELSREALSKSRTALSPSKFNGHQSYIPLHSSSSSKSNNIVTSPLKSLRNDHYLSDKENIETQKELDILASSESDEEGDDDTYSTWRKEQLYKLNKAKAASGFSMSSF